MIVPIRPEAGACLRSGRRGRMEHSSEVHLQSFLLVEFAPASAESPLAGRSEIVRASVAKRPKARTGDSDGNFHIKPEAGTNGKKSL